MMTSLAPILTPEEAATLLRCTKKTVEDRLRAGDLPGEKFGEGWIIPADALLQRINELAVESMNRRRKGKEPAAPTLVAIGQDPAGRGRKPPPF